MESDKQTARQGDSPSATVALPERSWLARHGKGDPLAFAQLLNAYRRPVYSYLLRCGVAESARDDLFQQVFLRIHNSAASYQAARPLAPWIFTIVANLVRNHFRDQARLPVRAEEEEVQQLADARPGVERQLQGQELSAWLANAILALPLPQREVVGLVLIQGLAQGDTAAILEMPVNSVKTHLRRARLALVHALHQHEMASEGDRHVEL